MRDKEPLRGRLTVLHFGVMVGGSGLVMLLSLAAALISGDDKYLDVVFFLCMTASVLGWFTVDVVDFFAPHDERNSHDVAAEPAPG
ncbi:MAG: hypothetical protein OXE46_15735 [Chloroflexi bacterium]|nr:hypothetical protein [Chloroflexota bacterium]